MGIHITGILGGGGGYHTEKERERRREEKNTYNWGTVAQEKGRKSVVLSVLGDI